MNFFPDDILAEVARANDIVEVISSYFPLKRAGKDYKALCPFHSEKTPSFTVSPSKQIFKCFGCGRGGGVFNFIMAKENVTFPEAVRMLAERRGIKLPSRRAEAAAETGVSRRQLYRTLEWATKWYSKWLQEGEGKPAREYLKNRGLDKSDLLAKFRIGFAPGGWDNLLQNGAKSNVAKELLLGAGLVLKRGDGSGYYDRFRNRLMFPIFDTLGRPIGFGGRILDGAGSEGEEPKYINSPETAVFKKGESLYGLPQARQAVEESRRVIIVEGYTDVLMAHQMGVENVVATLGTALTDQHIRLLQRFADEAVVIFDSDLAGRRAADRSLELFLAQDVNISVVALPEGKDPFDFLKSEGRDKFLEVIRSAKEALEYKWQLVQEEFKASSSIAGQRRAIEAMLATLAQVPVLAKPGTSLRRDLLMQKISRTLGIAEDTLRRELTRLQGRPRVSPGDKADAEGPTVDRVRRNIERDLLSVLVCSPSRLESLTEGLSAEDFLVPVHRRLFQALSKAAGQVRDGEIGGLTAYMQSAEVASLAVELYDTGQAKGDLDKTWQGVLRALKRAKELREYWKHRESIKQVGNNEEKKRALRAIQEARPNGNGFLPPKIAQR